MTCLFSWFENSKGACIKHFVIRVLSTGGGRGEASPPKSFPEKNLNLFQIKIFFDDDFKESVKVTNVQKCNFSQS